jgi:hypothetical protein
VKKAADHQVMKALAVALTVAKGQAKAAVNQVVAAVVVRRLLLTKVAAVSTNPSTAVIWESVTRSAQRAVRFGLKRASILGTENRGHSATLMATNILGQALIQRHSLRRCAMLDWKARIVHQLPSVQAQVRDALSSKSRRRGRHLVLAVRPVAAVRLALVSEHVQIVHRAHRQQLKFGSMPWHWLRRRLCVQMARFIASLVARETQSI